MCTQCSRTLCASSVVLRAVTHIHTLVRARGVFLMPLSRRRVRTIFRPAVIDRHVRARDSVVGSSSLRGPAKLETRTRRRRRLLLSRTAAAATIFIPVFGSRLLNIEDNSTSCTTHTLRIKSNNNARDG